MTYSIGTDLEVQPKTRFNFRYSFAILGGLMMVLFSFAPWNQVAVWGNGCGASECLTKISGLGTVAVTGNSPGGIFPLLIGSLITILALIGAFLNKNGFAVAAAWLSGLSFLISTAVVLVFINSDHDYPFNGGAYRIILRADFGMYMVVIGAFVALVGSLMVLLQKPRFEESKPPTESIYGWPKVS